MVLQRRHGLDSGGLEQIVWRWLARPQFELPLRLRDQHLETTNREAPFLFGGLLALCVWAYKPGTGSAHAGGSSHGGGTSSGYATTSFTSASSGGYGSTSYASTGYSGGGGSSGGGGASSSW